MQRGNRTIPAWLDRMYEHRFLIFIISLLLLLGAWPLVTIVPAYRLVLEISLTLVIFSGLFAMKCERKLLVLALLLGLPAVITQWIVTLAPNELVHAAGDLFPILFLAFFAVFLLRAVLVEERITRDTIAGALSIYLLLGIIWALSYQFIDQIYPDSFYLNPDIWQGGALSRMDYLYFSFITLTTVGYGDITPVTPVAQSLSYFEAVTGVIYIAVLITRLVGTLQRRGDGNT